MDLKKEKRIFLYYKLRTIIILKKFLKLSLLKEDWPWIIRSALGLLIMIFFIFENLNHQKNPPSKTSHLCPFRLYS